MKIDDVTFDELGRDGPSRATLHARAIDRIAADGPRAIAYDIQFSEAERPSGRRRHRARRGASSTPTGRVVLATTEPNERGEGRFLGGPEEVLTEDIGARLGNGCFRTIPGV